MSDQILYNAIRTPDGTILESKHRHDFVQHKDKNGQYYAVDGGLDYLKRNFDVNDFEDISVYDDNSHENRRKYIKWGSNYDKDMKKLPKTLYKCIKDMDTDHIQAILDGNWCRSEFHLKVFKDELEYRKNVSS